MNRKFLTWQFYIRFLYVCTSLYVMFVLYTLFLTQAWLGADGGLGLYSALLYLFYAITLIIVSHITYHWLRRYPTALRLYLATFWIVVAIGIVAITLTLTSAHRHSDNQADIKDALQACTVKEVSWSYQPATLTIDYADRVSFQLKEWSDPAFLSAEVQTNMDRCDASYNFFMNGKLVTQ